MMAYIKTITIEDDDGDKLGELHHSVDDVYLWIPSDGKGAYADDYKFIAEVLESFTGVQYTDEGLSHYHKDIYTIELKDKL